MSDDELTATIRRIEQDRQNELRRARYASDPAYRQRRLDQRQLYREPSNERRRQRRAMERQN